jgi:DNA-binding transcriptional LysR family regulator
MNEQQLVTFIEVARKKHFRQAAEALKLTQPAVSAQIRSLEEELGTTLFYRSQVKLTSSGSLFLPYALQIVDLIREGKEIISQNEKKPLGRPLIIGITSCLTMTILRRLIKYFQLPESKLPLRVLTFSAAEILNQMNEGQIDVGIAYSFDNLPHHFETRTLFYDSFTLIVSNQHPMLKAQAYITKKKLAKLPLISFAPSMMERKLLDQLFQKHQIQPHIQIELTSVDEIKNLVVANFGIALIPTVAVDTDSKTYRKIRVLEFEHSFPVNLYYPIKRYRSKVLEQLINDISGIYPAEEI